MTLTKLDPIKQEPVIKLERGPLEKIAIAQIHCEAGRIGENLLSITNAIEQARQKGADTIIFPELTIPGYCAMDLFYKPAFLANNQEALAHVIEASAGMTVIVGFADWDESKSAPGDKPLIYNAAAIIHDQNLISVQRKELLPTYGIFDEQRHFAPGTQRSVIELNNGDRFAVAICEDLWGEPYGKDIAGELKALGAQTIFTLNASPYNQGKVEAREQVLMEAAKKHGVHIVYANLVGGYDGYDGELIFDGRSLIVDPSGKKVFEAPSFSEALSVVELNQESTLPMIPPIPLEEIHRALIVGIKDFFRRANMSKAIIGLSGGIDSAVVAALAVEALGPENVLGVTMPSHITSGETKDDAYLLAERLGIRIEERSIKPEYDAWIDQFREKFGRDPSSLAKQNKQAKIRQSILTEYPYETPGMLMLNTGNKDEIDLGYFTLYGDAAGALSVLGDLHKPEIFDLARLINTQHGHDVIPVTTIERAPSAELEEGQTDENSLPAAYPVLSPLITAIIEEGQSIDELKQKFPLDVIERTLALTRGSEAKRRQLPPAIRVTDPAFGIGRRIPMNHTFAGN